MRAGDGWSGQPSGTLQYSSRSFPRFGTFRTDVGLGLDLGIFGVYVAKAVSSSEGARECIPAGAPPILGMRTHASFLAAVVF